MAKAIIECAIGYTPAGCGYGLWGCGSGIITHDPNAGENCVAQAVGCFGGPLGNTASCLWSFFRCKCPGTLGQAAACARQAIGGGTGPQDASVGLGLSPVDPRDVWVAHSVYGLFWLQMLLGDTQGDGRWFSSGSGGALGLWMSAFGQAIATNSAEGLFISSSEAQTLLELPLPNTVSTADAQNAIDRWNLSVTNWNLGSFRPPTCPPEATRTSLTFTTWVM